MSRVDKSCCHTCLVDVVHVAKGLEHMLPDILVCFHCDCIPGTSQHDLVSGNTASPHPGPGAGGRGQPIQGPNKLAHICSGLFVGVYEQSRGGG